MNKKTIPRFTGQPEMWHNVEKNIVVVRESKHSCEVFYLDSAKPSYWNFAAFKKAWTFDFYDGSTHLVDNGFELITRL